jgi:hypothetical protein
MRVTKSRATSSDTFLFTLRIPPAPWSREPSFLAIDDETSKSPFKGPYFSKDFGFSDITNNSTTLMPISSSVASRPLVISTDPLAANEKGVESGRTCDLLDRPREPPPGTYSPEPQGVGKDDPD